MPNKENGDGHKPSSEGKPPAPTEPPKPAAVEPPNPDAVPRLPIEHKEASDGPGHHEHGPSQRGITEQEFVDRIKKTDRWMIGLTAVIAIAGIVSAFIFGWQLSTMKGQLDVMEDDSKDRKKESGATVRLVLRQEGGLDGWRITPNWINIGKTNAIKVSGWSDYHFFEYGKTIDKYDFMNPSFKGK